MQKIGLIILTLLLPVSGFSETGLKEDLWQKVGLELRKPLFKKHLVVSRVNEGSLMQRAGILEGDILKEATILGSCEGRPDKKILASDKDNLIQAMLDVNKVLDLSAGGKACVLVSQVIVKLERGGREMFLLLSGGYRHSAIGATISEEDGRVMILGLLRGSTAELNGLQEGDAILMVDGSEVKVTEDVIQRIRAKEVGVMVNLVVMRGGKKMHFQLPVGVVAQEPKAELLVNAAE